MTDEELDRAVEVAVRLGAEQATETDGSGYVHQFPDWLYDACDAALPEHLSYGYVEGVFVQRGPASIGGYRLAGEADTHGVPSLSTAFGSFHAIFPIVLRARVRRLLLEAQGSGHVKEPDSRGPAPAPRSVAPVERVRG